MDKKTGVCQWMQGPLLKDHQNGLGTCTWDVTATEMTEALVPTKPVAATTSTVCYAAQFDSSNTPVAPVAKKEETTTTTTTTDDKKEDGAYTLAASAAALATAAFMY